MANWLTRLLDRAFAVVGALVGAQAPMFIQQYNQQLSGRVAELKLQIEAIINIAAQSQKSIRQFIQRFIDSGDPDFMRQGDLMLSMNERYEGLLNASHQLSSATVISKPFVFIREFNWEIARSTFADFQAGVPFTLEGFCYALVGVGFGYGVFYLLTRFLKFFYRLFVRCAGKLSSSND